MGRCNPGDVVRSRRPADLPLGTRTVVHQAVAAPPGRPGLVLLRSPADPDGRDLLLVEEDALAVVATPAGRAGERARAEAVTPA